MMTVRNSAFAEKRDLHVGGTGSSASAGLATMEPAVDTYAAWARKARDTLRDMDESVRDNPWAAIGLIALAGLAAGYLLSRRT